jgi:hypothetical protein
MSASSFEGMGLAVLFLRDLTSPEQMSSQIRFAASLPARGRCLAVVWDPGTSLPAPAAVESIATNLLMGNPRDRVEPLAEGSDELSWLLFGTIAVRLLEPHSEQASGYRSVIIFRSVGPKAYLRRKAAEASLLEQSKIAVAHKAFTRDVANNTWHFVPKDCDDLIVDRLAYLMTWADEQTAVVEDGNVVVRPRSNLDLDASLIPVPTKRAYYREPTLLGEDLA